MFAPRRSGQAWSFPKRAIRVRTSPAKRGDRGRSTRHFPCTAYGALDAGGGMRKWLGTILGLTVLFAAACGSPSSPSTLLAATPLSGTVKSIKVTGPPLVVG